MLRLTTEGRELVLPSPREAEVLRLTAEGLANKEIAYCLGIKECTVKKNVNQMRRQLGFSKTSMLVAWAVSQPAVFYRQAVSPAPYRVTDPVPIRPESARRLPAQSLVA